MENCEERFQAIYQTHVDEIYAYLLTRSGMLPPVAEDLTQETFVAVYQGLNRFRGLCSQRTWVFRIARNKLIDYYRIRCPKAMELISLDDERTIDIADEQLSIEKLVSHLQQSQRIAACFASLPEHYRMVLSLKYLEELSVKEITCLSQRNEKSIENALWRAKAAFAKQYLTLEQEDNSNEAD